MADNDEIFQLRKQNEDGTWGDWVSVSREQWIEAERGCGFVPKGVSSLDPAYRSRPATGSFSKVYGDSARGVEGRRLNEEAAAAAAPRI